MPGRRPKPTALKLIEGNPGRRPINKAEPKPQVEAPTCPKHLNAAARREWRRVVPELLALGIITKLDRAGLAVYCQAYARWEAAEAALACGAPFVMDGKRRVENPHLAQARKEQELMRKYLIEFGLTPAARSKITTTKKPAKNSFSDLA